MTRAAVLRDPTIAAGIGQFAAIQAVVPVGMELSAISLQDPGAIEAAVAAFARGSNGGLVMTASWWKCSTHAIALTRASGWPRSSRRGNTAIVSSTTTRAG